MGTENTGAMGGESDAGGGLGRTINRDPGDRGPLNPSATAGTRGYEPVRLGSRAMAERTSYNKTKIEIRPRKEPAIAGGVTGGAFYTMRTVADAVDPDDNGDIYLQGGMVSGGTGNVVIPDIKLYDASTDAWVGSAGDTLIITVTGAGQETSGILDPIYNIDMPTGAVVSIGAIGSNTLPEVGSVSGKICYLLLGSYFEGGFSPSAPGNFMIGFCYGNYSKTRG